MNIVRRMRRSLARWIWTEPEDLPFYAVLPYWSQRAPLRWAVSLAEDDDGGRHIVARGEAVFDAPGPTVAREAAIFHRDGGWLRDVSFSEDCNMTVGDTLTLSWDLTTDDLNSARLIPTR